LRRNSRVRCLSEITTAEIEVHVARFTGGARTKNNLIATLKTFFLWAQKHGHLRHDKTPVTETLNKIREPSIPPEIFTVEEMTKILAAAEPEMIPYLAIGSFAGLRSAETEKIEWQAVDSRWATSASPGT